MGNPVVSDPILSDPIACGVILAGGEGRRMGGVDKALVQLGDQTLIARVHARLAPQVGQVAISANGDPARFAPLGLPVLADARRFGPLAGIASGLRWAQGLGAAALVSVPVDGPFLPRDLVARLGPVQSVPRLAMAGGRLHPAHGIWPVSLIGALAEFLALGVNPRLRDFADLTHAVWVEFPDPAAFDNLNTLQDLSEAETRLAEGRP